MSELPTTRLVKPYVGPSPIEHREAFFGRDHEVNELLVRLKANHTVLLYSPSGAGKTSLIKAGLIPRLREQNYCVLPTIRLNRQLEPSAPTVSSEFATGALPVSNRFLLSAQISLDEGLDKESLTPLDQLAEESLF